MPDSSRSMTTWAFLFILVLFSIEEKNMPLYEYKCPRSHRFEARQEVKQSQYARCPNCELMAEKVFSGVNFSFGFRLTDESLWEKGKRDEVERNV
jgi:putative FmdB family regulatory protein